MAPVELQGKLRALRSRLRRFFVLDGLSRAVAAGIAVVTVSVFFDWVTRPKLPGPMRLVLLVGGMGLLAYVIWRYLVVPLTIRLSEDDMAIAVERARPDLRDRLISTVQLSRETEQPEFTASREMVQALAAETVAATSGLKFEEVARLQALRRQLMAGGVALGFALLMAGLAPTWVKVGLARYFAPFSAVSWPATTEIEVRDLPAVVARGDNLEVVGVQTRGAKARGEICYRYAGEHGWASDRLLADDRGVFRREFRGVADELQFYFHAGDGYSPMPPQFHRVKVVDRPEVEQVSLRYIYPPYTKLNPADGEKGAGEAKAVVGTRVVAAVKFNREVNEAKLAATDNAPENTDIQIG